ncbi:MAG: SsrA-binding protein SmpB [Lentisphaeria bacterium]|nr:SsrA-binding protein SmpB [Lentisphaeria bacterium]
MAKKDKNDKETASDGVIAGNKKAYHDYQILSSMEAGIALHGTEVKSCRMHSVSLQDAFAKIDKGEVFVYNINISPYSHGNRFNHTPMRQRRLLLHKREILRLSQQVKEKGYSLIPLKMYLTRGKIKIQLGVAKGKTFEDKRDTLRKRQDDLDMRRAMKV